MPILGSSSLAANKDMISKIVTNGIKFSDLVENIVGKRTNCSIRAISSFPTIFSKAIFCYCVRMSTLNKGLMTLNTLFLGTCISCLCSTDTGNHSTTVNAGGAHQPKKADSHGGIYRISSTGHRGNRRPHRRSRPRFSKSQWEPLGIRCRSPENTRRLFHLPVFSIFLYNFDCWTHVYMDCCRTVFLSTTQTNFQRSCSKIN